MQNDQLSVESEPTAGGRPQPWPLPDVVRARDFLVSALTEKAVLPTAELELLADLDREVATRTGSKPRALEQLLFSTRLLQSKRERQIALVRRRVAGSQEPAC